MTKKDFFIAGLLTLFASLFIFINLGSAASPESFWESREGDKISIVLKNETEISDIYINFGISKQLPQSGGKLLFELCAANGSIMEAYDIFTFDEAIYSWISLEDYHYPNVYPGLVPEGSRVGEVRITVVAGQLRINEIVLVDGDGFKIDLSEAVFKEEAGTFSYFSKVFDEQKKFFPDSRGHEMYLDETYHARAAYERINGWEVYEKANPALGQLIIGLGIRIFGMNPLGWRFMSALFRLFTVPLLYFMGKKLFRSEWFGAVFAGVNVLDGISLALARFAALDTIGLFFILLSYFFMLCFFKTDIKKAYKKSLLWLALSAAAFVLAAGVSPAGLYMGAGLAAILIAAFVRDKKILAENGSMHTSVIAAGLYAAAGVAAGIAWFSPVSGANAFYRAPLNLWFTANYWIGLLAAFIISLSLLLSQAGTGVEPDAAVRRKNTAVIFLLAGAVSAFLPLIFVPWFSFAYHYGLAIVFFAGFLTAAIKEITLLPMGKIALRKSEISKGVILCAGILLLFVVYFLLTFFLYIN